MSSPGQEPMSLGSPPTSPSANTSQFLPQFLLGDPSFNTSQLGQRNSPKFWASGNSPPRGMGVSRSFSTANYDNNSKYSNVHQEKIESIYSGHHSSSNQIHHHGQDRMQEPVRPGAPPINRLVDTFNKPSHLNLTPKINLIDSRKFTDPYASQAQDLSFTPTPRISPPSPTQIDPFYTHGESIKVDDKLDETWVTVFGFPSSATTYILQEFSIYGQILRYVPSNGGNWMHIQYLTKLHAQKALSKNGKILANSIMIAVMRCIDKKVMQQSQVTDENASKLPSSSSDAILSAINKPNEYLANQTGSKLGRSSSLRTGMRPLGANNRHENQGNFSTAGDSRLPRKNNGVISKAMEYMFGW